MEVDLCASPQILTTTLVMGALPLDRLAGQAAPAVGTSGQPAAQPAGITQAMRDELGLRLLQLTLAELFEWCYMQTDPNWSNFLYRASPGPTCFLLDFGAAREYAVKFVAAYLRIVDAARSQVFLPCLTNVVCLKPAQVSEGQSISPSILRFLLGSLCVRLGLYGRFFLGAHLRGCMQFEFEFGLGHLAYLKVDTKSALHLHRYRLALAALHQPC